MVMKKDDATSGRIFTFSYNENSEDMITLRNSIKSARIEGLILFDMNSLPKKLSNGEFEIIECNKFEIPIIFYGGTEAAFKTLLQCYKWNKRIDIDWIKNLDNFQALKEMAWKINHQIITRIR
jgi:hypothetical protein